MKAIMFPCSMAAVLGLLLTPAAIPASAQDQQPPAKLLARAKISQADAAKIALAAVPDATVKDAELEEEDGGLRWSFDLKTPGSKNTTEVGVDAVSGKIVENKVESSKDEAKEKDADEKKADAPKAH